jgi:hypothetical protein
MVLFDVSPATTHTKIPDYSLIHTFPGIEKIIQVLFDCKVKITGDYIILMVAAMDKR